MQKRERLEKTLAGEATDRVPVALWQHWPGDDQRSADLAAAVLAFQTTYDWDFTLLAPANTYAVTDYGLQSTWQGDLNGTRAIIKRPVKRSLDWTELRTLDPMRGETGKVLEAVRLVAEANEAPLLVTIYSPLTQAMMLGEGQIALRNMRTHPDRLHSGLNVLTESVLNFITALRRVEIAGICYVAAHADYALMSEAEYQMFGSPYDYKILESLPVDWWLNMLHLPSSAPMLDLMAAYPVQAIGWDLDAIDLDRAYGLPFKGAFCTGLSAEKQLHYGTPLMIKEAARRASQQAGSRRLILTAGHPVAVGAPRSNLRAVRDIVEGAV